jgi:hypothetical protein
VKTEQEEILERKRIFARKIENLLGTESFQIFKVCFKSYKSGQTLKVDDYCKALFEAFFGSREPVCWLEVSNYALRKQVLQSLDDEVMSRHQDRFKELVKEHVAACEKKQRTAKSIAKLDPDNPDSQE